MISNLFPPDSAAADIPPRAVLARPALKFLFLTGHATADLIDQTQKQGHLVLQKPFTPETLLTKVREALLKRDVRNVG